MVFAAANVRASALYKVQSFYSLPALERCFMPQLLEPWHAWHSLLHQVVAIGISHSLCLAVDAELVLNMLDVVADGGNTYVQAL